jgi:arylsulfatase A-like enzyme
MAALRRFALLLLVTSVFAPGFSPATPAKAGGTPRPNVLIIVTDDQRTDTMAVMPTVQKWFVQGGTSYPNAYVSTPLCCPSRATIMTGRYAHNHGVVDNSAHHTLDQRTTLQHQLRRTGYRTAIVGKYFNGWPLHQKPLYFDRWSIFRSGYYNAKFGIDGKVRTINRYATDFLARQSRRYMKGFEKKDGAPWLMYVTPSAPHQPFTPSPDYATAPVPEWEPAPSVGEEDRSDKPPYVRSQGADRPGSENIRAAQLRTLMSVDDMVNTLMETLIELREFKRTLVFFLSDNGFFWAEHGLTDKRLPYTEAINVPLYARWSGRIQAGGTDRRLVSLVDVAPTVLQAAGVPQDPFLPQPDGRSLLDVWERDHLYMEYFPDNAAVSIGPWASTRTRTDQYSEYYRSDTTTIDFQEYYDLEDDPFQLRNLMGDLSPGNDPSPTELQDLSLQLANDRRCQGTTGPNPCP